MTIRSIKRSFRPRAGRVLGVTAVTVFLGGFAAAAPAMATVSRIKNSKTGLCITSNSAGHVSAAACSSSKDEQWNNPSGSSRLIDVGTGLCLDDNYHQGVFTTGCNNFGLYQTWFSLFIGNDMYIWNDDTLECLDDNIHQGLFMNGCNEGPWQLWETSFPTALL